MSNKTTASSGKNAAVSLPSTAVVEAVAPQLVIPRRLEKKAFFLPYQAAWIRDNSRLKLMEKSRQIGLSWSTAYALVRRMSITGGSGLDAWVSSRDDLQARLFKEDCNHFASLLHTACRDLGQAVIDDQRGISAYVLHMASGRRIHSMSSNPDAQAGKRGDRILDEFALHPDPRKLWSIAYPGITWGGQMEIISTHRGSQNYFNLLVQEIREGGNPKGISLHRVTLQDALDQGFLSKLKQKLPKDDPRQDMDEADYFDFIRAGCADEESFLQEYMCVPADDASAFISYDLLDACTMPRGEAWETELDPEATYYMGVDVGRRHDLTVMYLVEAIGTQRITRRIIEMQNATFAEQAAVLDKYAAMPWVKRICMDATGIGMQLAEDAHTRHGAKVEQITFTAGVKEDLALTLRRAMEDSALRIPPLPALAADLRSIRKETTSAGNVRYVGERTADGHADRFWALALSLHASKASHCFHVGVLGAGRLRGARPVAAATRPGLRGKLAGLASGFTNFMHR